ncbi:MAG: putative inner rane protein translocase component YidC, partial [Rhizobium sp.]|nr:putative inner rane protein translocase component YidC [Rhizobium sp.]
MQQNRNYYLAIVLSVLIVFVWQFFYMGPKMEAQRVRDEAHQAELAKQKKVDAVTAQKPVVLDASGQPIPGTEGANVTVVTRDQALAQSPRVVIDTPKLSGSINLTGARLDDLRLKKYHETVDKSSPLITLFNPGNTHDGYFVELGYTGAPNAALPGPQTKWQVSGNDKLTPETPVTLTYKTPTGIEFSRKISVDSNYMFQVEDTVKNTSVADVPLVPYGRVVRYQIPAVAPAYVLHEGYVGVLNGTLQETTFAKDNDPVKHPGNTDGWFGITDKYWAAAIVPPKGSNFDSSFIHVQTGQQLFQADYREISSPVLKAGESKTLDTKVFAGAKEVDVIDAYQEKSQITDFYKLIDWGWFRVITRPMFKLMDFLYKYFGNFGLAILGTTVIVKLLFFPIANRQYASMAKMKKLQPKMEELKSKFGDDKMGLQTAMMGLYKEEKVNPLAGCWPVVLQIPVFFALYKVIYITIEMRHAPFYGWIHDLSSPDPTTLFNLFGLIPWTPPHALMLGVWPIIMGITMFVQMRMNPTPPDATQAMIFNWMPLVFTFM